MSVGDLVVHVEMVGFGEVMVEVHGTIVHLYMQRLKHLQLLFPHPQAAA